MTKIASLPAELDEFDLKLLDALQENNQRTSEELADLVHLSPASCLRRARRLREIKAIVADVSIVAPEVIGPRMTMIVTGVVRARAVRRRECVQSVDARPSASHAMLLRHRNRRLRSAHLGS